MKGILFNPGVILEPAREFENVQRLRGWIVDCFARSEYLLTDFGLHCLGLIEFEKVYTSFPGDFKKKTRRIIKILQGIHPQDSSYIEEILNDLLEDYEARNVLCHGFVTGILDENANRSYRFCKWVRDGTGHDKVIMDFTVGQMFVVANRLGLASSKLFEALRSKYEVRGWTEGSIFDVR